MYIYMFRTLGRTPRLSYGVPAHYLVSSTARQRSPLNSSQYGKRHLSSSILVPPLAFFGIGIVLWTYKCLMMVVFQNRILYMPSIPPYSRSEKLEDYAQICHPIKWEEEQIKASDGTRLSIITSDIEVGSRSTRPGVAEDNRLLVLYFQGNASSLPPRTPHLADTMKAVSRLASSGHPSILSLVGVSYRGYWKSRGRPSQRGIELDAAAALDWAAKKYSSTPNLNIVLWGESIGAGVVTTAAAKYQEVRAMESAPVNGSPIIKALILETPFTNLSDLLRDFYPQRWLPYRYLTPFLISRWDSKLALQRIAQTQSNKKPKVFILQAGKDEVVPGKHGEELEEWCKIHSLDLEIKSIRGALHTDKSPAGREAIARYLVNFL